MIESIEDYPENYVIQRIYSTKSFVEIEGWTLEDYDGGKQRNNLVYRDWAEAPQGENLSQKVFDEKRARFDKLVENTDRFWTYIEAVLEG